MFFFRLSYQLQCGIDGDVQSAVGSGGLLILTLDADATRVTTLSRLEGSKVPDSILGMPAPSPIEDVSIGGDVIRLGQFLQFAGLFDSGGDAKGAILDGDVSVNGEVDRRRGRQLHDGDIVALAGHRLRVRP